MFRRIHIRSGTGSALAAGLAGLLAFSDMFAPLSLFDAGITASAGTFILHGQLPYRDFWLLYGPLTGYLAALLAALFGNHVQVLRLAGLLVVMATAAVGHRIVSPHAPGPAAVALGALAAAVPVVFSGLDLAPWPVGVLLGLTAVLLARTRSPRGSVAAGLVAGFAMLVRPDLGIYALAAIVMETRSLRPTLGTLLVVAPVAAASLVLVPLPALWDQLVWFPLVGQRVYRSLPTPGIFQIGTSSDFLLWMLYWTPVVLVALAVVRRLRTGHIPHVFVGLLALATLCRLQALVRPDVLHSAEAMTPAILLAAYVIPWPLTRWSRVAMAVPTALLVALAALPVWWLVLPPDPYDHALDLAASIVRQRTGVNERIFVGEVRNRHTWLNPVVAYYVADRPAGVHDSLFNPGVTNTEVVQQRIVEDLRNNSVRYLVLDARYADCYETSNASRFLGSTVLDDAIARDYRVLVDFGAIVVMVRRGEASDILAATIWVDPHPPRNQGAFVCDGS